MWSREYVLLQAGPTYPGFFPFSVIEDIDRERSTARVPDHIVPMNNRGPKEAPVLDRGVTAVR